MTSEGGASGREGDAGCLHSSPGLPCTQRGFVSAQGWPTRSLDTLCRQNSRNVQETTDLSLGPQATSSVLESFCLPI